MNRYLVNAQMEFSTTYYVDGVDTDPTPDSATVTIVRDDGTVIINGLSATPGTPPPAGTFVYDLTPGQNNRLDRMTATFVSALGNSVQQGEIVGGYLIGSADLVELYPNNTNAERADRRTDIEIRLEEACGRAFVPRYEREVVTMDRRGVIRLKWGSLRRILSVITDYQTLTTDQIANLHVNHDMGHIWGVPKGTRSREVTITYEHGWDGITPSVRNAALSAIQEMYGPNRIDGRIRTKIVDNVRVTYDNNTTGGSARLQFASTDVVSFILNNRRPLIG